MNQIEVGMNEWMLTQGLVGYKRIMEFYGETIQTTQDGLVVEKQHLQQLPDALFSYFINKYSVAKREEKVLRSYHSKWKSGDKSYKPSLNKRLKVIETKVGKYFKEDENGQACLTNIQAYREQKNYSEELDEWLETIIQKLYTKIIDEKLTVNFFKAVHFTPYAGQVSFLNVTNNSKTPEEQKEIFRKDFIDPVLEEWALIDAMDNGSEEDVKEIVENSNHRSIKSLKRPFRKKTIAEMKTYLDEEIHQCSLTDFPFGFLPFEEGVFSPLALSLKQAINMTWNSSGNMILPISALARLLLFCAPAGATISNGKSVFIQYDGNFDDIYRSNEHYSIQKDRDRAFDEIVFDLAREQKFKADLTKRHYLILEYESDYTSKKTLLDYMIMTPNLVYLFQNHENLFTYMHYTNRIQLIRTFLRKQDPRVLIYETLRDKVKNRYSSVEVVFMTLLRHFNQIYLEEGLKQVDTQKQSSYVWVLYKSAENLKRRLGDKKAQGIAYRLLNAVRSNNKHQFLDTVMRVYISCEQEMPSLLLEVLHENKMDFETAANAWIAGLIAKSNDLGKGEEEHVG